MSRGVTRFFSPPKNAEKWAEMPKTPPKNPRKPGKSVAKSGARAYNPPMPPSAANNLDRDGYRKNVGIVVCNDHRQVLWARRIRHDGWQFPQGGVKPDESAREAALRELEEEVGLTERDVRLLGATENWLHYDVPYRHRLRGFRGQKQRWFLFKLTAPDSSVRLDLSDAPEFDHWRWVDYWLPPRQIVRFKRQVYERALSELEQFLDGARA